MVYGILVQSVQDAIITKFGKELWEQLQEFLNFDGNTLLQKKIYSDDLFGQIIDALILFRQEGDHDYYMEFFGNAFVGYFSHYGFEKILRVAGRNFRDFLYSIDQLHDSNRFMFPQMKSPLFFVESEDENGAYLHYQSTRRGFNYYVIGQIKECCKRFYNQSCEVRIHQDISDDKQNHVIYRIDFKNQAFLEDNDTRSVSSVWSTKMNNIMSGTLLNLFPFSVGFGKDLKIKFIGHAFESLFTEELVGKNLFDTFKINRPPFHADWNSILINSSSVIFELENICELKTSDSKDTKLKIKGQMKLLKDIDAIAFLGHPVINDMEEMSKFGLYLNDLNKFDGSAEMLVTEMQHEAQLQKAYETQQSWTASLEETRLQLNQWKKKGKKLLYSMLPARIAQLIESGVKPNSICETFEEVTIMFVNTVDFSSIVKNAEPNQLIKFVNSTISVYDGIVSTYDKVHKIETKADGSYLIVTGLDHHSPNDSSSLGKDSMFSVRTNYDEETANKRQFPHFNQCELICAVALEIIENSHELHNPFESDYKEALKIKIGFHTGSIVAGIVGLSNIQFCLFGDTVNTASRMCSNSDAGKILLSDNSFSQLKNSTYYECEFRDTIQVKVN
ncbi:soluble guanylate cyclase 88E-like isoform X1 [Brachionus plicatilis]|uniref:guanylate cyclase n=1 Tax=Brachionus plicatilis TaxID=10195 RepID=A0A3M7RDG9_BRAPC|nr:soluble guanylate cyclase 88E-like isoform X1 [Brachionus plicatilis]